jgi:hypothetical protein
MQRKLLQVILLINILFQSCKKQANIDTDTAKPLIDIESPTPNTAYPAATGDCHIEFTANDDVALAGVVVNVTNAAGVNYYSNSLTISGKTYLFHDHLVANSINTITPFYLKIDVIDKKGNVETKTILFNLKP